MLGEGGGACRKQEQPASQAVGQSVSGLQRTCEEKNGTTPQRVPRGLRLDNISAGPCEGRGVTWSSDSVASAVMMRWCDSAKARHGQIADNVAMWRGCGQSERAARAYMATTGVDMATTGVDMATT
eukprot:4084614-Pyramimonas_sp.AAC.1